MTSPELALVLGIRVALGVGLGLLLASRFSSAEKRSAVGRTLLAASVFTGACLGAQVLGRRRPFKLTFDTGTYRSETRWEPRQRVESRKDE
jgi:hypothetical protein